MVNGSLIHRLCTNFCRTQALILRKYESSNDYVENEIYLSFVKYEFLEIQYGKREINEIFWNALNFEIFMFQR